MLGTHKCFWCRAKGKDFHSRVLPGIGSVRLCPGCKRSHDAAAREPAAPPVPQRRR